MSNKYVTLDEFLNERGDFVKQVVYKIDGDYIGDIKGENVTVILMGNGDFKGDINSKDGTVFLNKGNIIGNIKADKVLCPTKPEETSEKKKGTYRGKSGITVKCPICGGLYTQNVSMRCSNIQDFSANVEIMIDAEENAKKTLSHNPAKDVKSLELPTKKEFCSCYDCAHCHFGFETAHCSFKNKVIRGVTPCTNFEWRCRYDH